MRAPRFVRTAVVGALAWLVLAGAAQADLPGTIPLAAADAGHIWWVVRVEGEPERGPAGPGAKRISFALMHHAAADSGASERLVTRFGSEPLALASEGHRVVVVTRDAESGNLFIVSMQAARNEATGGWFTLPAGLPEVFRAPPEQGEVRAAAIAGGRLALLLRLRRETANEADRHWLGAIDCEGATAGSWASMPLPAVDLAERVHLIGGGPAFRAIGMRAGAAVLLEQTGESSEGNRASGSWRARELVRAEATPSRGEVAPRAIAGAFMVAGRVAAVERTDRVRVGLVRDGVVQPWAEFDEPPRAWALGPLASGAALLELGGNERAMIRELGLSDREPRERVSLDPPSIALHRWIHLPILAVLSVAMVLSAVIFGSDAYIQSRTPGRGAERPARTIRGASLGRRALAMGLDMLPGVLVVWAVAGGTPLDLLRIPTLQPDLADHLPEAMSLLGGWCVASIGDVAFGRSMGKRLAGLRIVAPDGAPARAGRRFARACCALVTVASPVVMLLALLHPHGDGPSEMLTGTVVAPESELEPAAEQGSDRPS